jgi:hypothetical protein
VGGKTRGAVRVCLELLAPPFLLREKVENKHQIKDEKKESL